MVMRHILGRAELTMGDLMTLPRTMYCLQLRNCLCFLCNLFKLWITQEGETTDVQGHLLLLLDLGFVSGVSKGSKSTDQIRHYPPFSLHLLVEKEHGCAGPHGAVFVCPCVLCPWKGWLPASDSLIQAKVRCHKFSSLSQHPAVMTQVGTPLYLPQSLRSLRRVVVGTD